MGCVTETGLHWDGLCALDYARWAGSYVRRLIGCANFLLCREAVQIWLKKIFGYWTGLHKAVQGCWALDWWLQVHWTRLHRLCRVAGHWTSGCRCTGLICTGQCRLLVCWVKKGAKVGAAGPVTRVVVVGLGFSLL